MTLSVHVHVPVPVFESLRSLSSPSKKIGVAIIESDPDGNGTGSRNVFGSVLQRGFDLGTALQLTNFYGDGFANGSGVEDTRVAEAWAAIQHALVYESEAKAFELHKELMSYVLEQVWAIPYPKAPTYTMWWPWLKNYYGENSVGYWNVPKWAQWAWVDQDLKKSMGY